MPDLSFEVGDARVVPYAVAPTMAFGLQIENRPEDERIHTIVLRCQVQIEVTRRHYLAPEQTRLRDLFGEPERWSQTLRNMLWTNTSVVVPQFSGTASVDLEVACSFDFNVAVTKYFAGLEEGEVPLCFLFSGTAFYENRGDQTLQVAPIPWENESRFRLPVQTWKKLMEAYYPNVAWLQLRQDVFAKLYAYKVQHGIPTWEQALERILPTTQGSA